MDLLKHLKIVCEMCSFNKLKNEGILKEKPPIYISNIEKNTFEELGCEGRAGVYIFKLTEKVTTQEQGAFLKSTGRTPPINKEYKKIDWEKESILYVGSSYDLNQRLGEHLLKCSNSTYSLRLFDPNRYEVKKKTELSYYYLDDEFVKYARIILPLVERELHKSKHPIIGTSRA